jgi:hypothetical protein
MNPTDLPGIVLRNPRNAEDLGFIVKGWLRSYKDSPWAGSMADEFRIPALRESILALVNKSEVRLACFEEDPDLLLGFVCYETGHDWPLVHYVYVKAGQDNVNRRKGIGSFLLDAAKEGHDAQARFTHRTKLGSYLFPKAKYYRPKGARTARGPAGNQASVRESA